MQNQMQTLGSWKWKSTLLAAAFLSACATTGSLKETQAPSEKLSRYPSITVNAHGAPTIDPKLASNLATGLTEDLKGAKLFQTVSVGASAKSGLLLDLEITEYKKGNSVARYMNMGGEAEIQFTASLVDATSKKVVSGFTGNGNSMRKSQTSFGGYTTGTFDDKTAKAMKAASEQIIEYLKKHY